MTIGDILRNLLADRDITQKALAENLNIGASTLSNYIQNTREPDYGTLKRLAGFFDVSTDYLLDHRTNQAASRAEDELLHVFRSLTHDQQELFIEQGKVYVAHNIRRGKTRDLKIADKKERYKKNGAK